MASYATPDDLVARHDVDVIGDLASDDRGRLSRQDILRHPNIQTCLNDASGDIDSALRRGGAYKPEQLAAMTGNDKSRLERITCWIAMAYLFERRPTIHQEIAEKYLERAATILDSIAKGDNVFGLTPDDGRDQLGAPTVDGPTSLEYDALNLMPERLPRYFMPSSERVPRTRR